MCANKSKSLPTPRWIVPFGSGDAATWRLFCFPHSGAGASTFSGWSRLFPKTIQVCGVQLPGREDRLAEPLLTEVEPLIDQLTTAILPFLDRPFALFGHSLGAALAYELTLRLQASQERCPGHLFVSARRPPSVPSPEARISALPDAELLREIRRRYTTSSAGFWDNPELVEIFLPILRADLCLAESDRFTAEGRIACPVTAFRGIADRLTREQLQHWERHAAGGFRQTEFSGGHDYLSAEREALTSAIAAALGCS